MHYGTDYDNAFWDGERMVFGDGDGEIFGRFTASLTVISHELVHGFTQYSTNLEYQGQSGALNESLSDVFGVLVEQRELGQDAADATWLVGAGIFTAQVQGSALRSLRAPGTAYDDDVLGRDPQPATMADYVETTSDNGGVHINSPGSPTTPSTSRRPPSADGLGRAPDASGTTPSSGAPSRRTATSRPSRMPPSAPRRSVSAPAAPRPERSPAPGPGSACCREDRDHPLGRLGRTHPHLEHRGEPHRGRGALAAARRGGSGWGRPGGRHR
ncbi:hypothetical protein MN0502_29330 [Arthrobacter sp. MN05-02]|nr:hypothetical protein MN0502_29330 [Arthrobacter sp. MN05-02]